MEVNSANPSFPAGFKEAVCEALVLVCRDWLTFTSLSVAGDLFVCLNHGKTSYLRIVESIPKNHHWSPLSRTSSLAGPMIKQELELQSFACCNDQTSVNVESLDKVTDHRNVVEPNVCEEVSTGDICDAEITGKINSKVYSECLNYKMEQCDDANSVDMPFKQTSSSGSGVSSKHSLLSSRLLSSSQAGTESQGNISSVFNYMCR